MTNNIPLPVDAIKAIEKYNLIKDCLKIEPNVWNIPKLIIEPPCPAPSCLFDASPSHDFGDRPFSAPEKEGIQDSWIFMVSNRGGGTLEWKVTFKKDQPADPDWITLYPTSGTGSGIVTVRIDTKGLALEDSSGTVHSGTVTVTASSYLFIFNWDKIPGDDNGRLIEFLTQAFGIAWVKTAKIEKIDNKTIKVSSERNHLSLELNDTQTKVNLKIDDGRTDEFIAIVEKGKLNVYKKKNRIGIGLSLKFIEIIEPESNIQEIEFSRLVPIITTSGIGKSNVSWDFRDEATLNLSNVNVLYIIIKTPIDSKGIKLSYSFYAQICSKGGQKFPAITNSEKFSVEFKD